MKKFLTMCVGILLTGLIIWNLAARPDSPPPLRWRKTLAMRYKA